jgi:hypothetical protein
LATATHGGARLLEPSERVGHLRQISCAVGRQAEPARQAVEQSYAERALECADLAADGRCRHVQLVGGEREALETTGSLEDTERG